MKIIKQKSSSNQNLSPGLRDILPVSGQARTPISSPNTPLTDDPEMTLAMNANALTQAPTNPPLMHHNATSHPLTSPWTNEKRQVFPVP